VGGGDYLDSSAAAAVAPGYGVSTGAGADFEMDVVINN
jgi:hypothetical protein